MVSQPTWGTFRRVPSAAAAGSRRTRAGKMPMQRASPSSLERHISCMPMQMPKTGCVSEGITVSSPRRRSCDMADEASPTPGRITLSAPRSRAGSAVSVNSAPARCRASATDRRLPVA